MNDNTADNKSGVAIWISFADPHKPKGQSFVGVVVLDLPPVDSILEAVLQMPAIDAKALALVPNWHDAMHAQRAIIPANAVPEELKNKLLSKDELISNDLVVLPN